MTTTSPSDWLQQLYQSSDVTAQSQAGTPPPPIGVGRVSDSTVVSTTIHTGGASNDSSPSNINYSFVHLGNLGGGSGSAGGNSISHDSQSSSMSTPTGSAATTGRVSKPARKRTRASRKNPTTLLNTDTKNFRAMVQRFTGGGVGVGTSASTTGNGGGAGYNIPAALYSAAGFGLAQGGGLQGQMGNFNQLQQGAGGGSSMMGLGMHYSTANPSVGVGGGVDQFSSLQHHNQLLPTAHQLYTFPNSSTAEISRGGASLRDFDRGVSVEGEAEEINPLLMRNVRQVGTAGGGGSDYSSSRGVGGGDTENNSSVRRFMF